MQMRPQPEPPTQEVLAGLVERVTYHNAENGFCVVRAQARGHRDVVTVVGHAATISAGEWITASGEWVNDRTHGQQFKARFLRTSSPTSADGIEKYLSSGVIQGVGPVYAKKTRSPRLWRELFEVIDHTGSAARGRRWAGLRGQHSRRLGRTEGRAGNHGLSAQPLATARAVRIFKTYGSDDPYRLARDIRGIGFKTADAIAMKLGIEKTAMIRVRSGISYALTEGRGQGLGDVYSGAWHLGGNRRCRGLMFSVKSRACNVPPPPRRPRGIAAGSMNFLAQQPSINERRGTVGQRSGRRVRRQPTATWYQESTDADTWTSGKARDGTRDGSGSAPRYP